MGVEIWLGALAPEAYELVLSSDDVDDVDLADVTAAKLLVRSPAPASAESEWAVSHAYDAETETLTLRHTFHATESELNRAGPWVAFALLTVPGGFVRSQPRLILVRGRFDVSPEG